MSANGKMARCSEIAPLFVFYLCEEASEQERERVEAHIAVCQPCAVQLSEERSLHETLTANLQTIEQLDPAGTVLSRCRSELFEALDDIAAPPATERWHPFGWIRRWMVLRPAWSAALLIFFGVLVGTQAIQWVPAQDGAPGNAVNVLAAPRLTDEQLSKMAVAGIHVLPSPDGPGTVQVQLRAEQPLNINASVDDPDMRRVLTYVVENGNSFDASVRMDCVDALRERTNDAGVRRALLSAARKDENAAVRLKALDSLQDVITDESVRDTLLEALQHDANPGVRVEAVNLLVRSLDGDSANIADDSDVQELAASPALPDAAMQRVIRTLQDLQRSDPNRYVRLRSAAALRQIGPRELQ
jgi:HEAT repeats